MSICNSAPTVSVSIQTPASDDIQKQLAIQQLATLYPSCSFTFQSSSNTNGKWIGIYTSSSQESASDKPNDTAPSNNVEAPPPVTIAVIFSIEDGQLTLPEKPFPHKKPYFIPIRADSEDISLLSPILKSLLSANDILIPNKLTFKYRTGTFAFWDKTNSNLIINNRGDVYQCSIDKEKQSNISFEDINDCLNAKD